MIIKKLLLFIGFINVITSFGQIPVDTWRVHLPYQDAKTVAVADDIVYCGTSVGLFSYHRLTGEIKKLTKTDGFSDVGISSMAYSEKAKTLIIGYENGNIDLIDSTGVPFNLPDIKSKLISASKNINNITIVDQHAYLACGFGIVLLNLSHKEITETYLIGEGGTFINVNQITFMDNNIYAATSSGVYFADFINDNLIDFNSWIKNNVIPNPNSSINGIVNLNNSLFISQENDDQISNTLYYENNGLWEEFDTTINIVRSISVSNNQLLISKENSLDVINLDYNLEYRIYTYNSATPMPASAIHDKDGGLWIADLGNGLIKIPWYGEYILIYPNGPSNANVYEIKAFNNKVFAAGGSPNNAFEFYGAYLYNDNQWENYNHNNFEELKIVPNISSVIIDPTNSNHMYGGSWGFGLIEIIDGEIVNVFDHTNSILENIVSYDSGGYIRITGMAYDSQNTLWMVASQSPNPVYAIASDGTWYNFELNNSISSTPLNKIISTRYGHNWSIIPKGGLYAWSVNNTLDDDSDDDYKRFSVKDDDGKIISNDVLSICEDNDGAVWIGLTEGVVVYYSPQNVFSGQNFYAQRPIIEVDGDLQYVLQTEAITAIAVDGGNRKWFGTQGSGVYLMSEDGRAQIQNFNENNSPLISNNISSIAINEKNGEVFIGTDKGIVSYKGTSTEGNDFFNDVYVYPNPIKPDYDGLITISGLVENVDVKITDVSGNLVYSTTATGGTAVWNGLSFMGEKVSTGIYLVFCTNEDGTKTHVTKLLFVN